MKKIEKLINIDSRDLTPTGRSIYFIVDKINEIVDAHNSYFAPDQAHNQSVSQPEGKKCESCGHTLGDTACCYKGHVFCSVVCQDSFFPVKVENNTEEKILKGIFGEDKRDEEDKKLDQRIVESHVDNTEEWKKELKELEINGSSTDVELTGTIVCGYRNLVGFIEQLLSERSFSKEELKRINKRVNEYDKDRYEDGLDRGIVEKVNRLLSLEK